MNKRCGGEALAAARKRSPALLAAILGTAISPYLFCWQTGQEVEAPTDAEHEYASYDVSAKMLFSNMVMYFIILATGATLFAAGKHDVQSATDAAAALRPIAGGGATILLSFGLIGTGFLAPPLLVLVMLIANNRKIMRARVNGRMSNALGWITTAVM